MKIAVCILICLLLIPLNPTLAQNPREILYHQTVTDTLSPDEERHEWEFEGIAGDILVITLHSEDFAPILDLRDTDRDPLMQAVSPMGGNARLILTVPNQGRYAIFVRAGDGAGGEYSLSLAKHDLSDVGPIAYGETRFSLRSSVDNPLWQFDGRRGDVVSIAVNSFAFDARLTLKGPDGGTVAADDDSGSSLNAFTVTMLPVDGRYSIEVDSFGAETGLYFISLDSVTADEILTYGDTIDGAIDFGGQVYLFEGQQDDVVLMSSASTEFDPVMSVQDTNGFPLALDDDGGDGHNAQTIIPLLSNGLYLIVVQPFALDQSGRFTVSLARVSLVEPTHLTVGDVVHGGQSDAAEARWTFDGQRGTPVDIRITSYGFDATFGLISPADNIIADDRSRGTNNSARILTVLPADGQYTILVRSLSLTGTLGPYTVSLQAAAVEKALAVGDVVDGQLQTGSNLFTFAGQADQRLSVLVESEVFDPVLDIYGTDGTFIGSQDDSDTGLNARLDLNLPATGTYFLVVRAIDGRRVGEYRLTVD